MHVFIVSAIQPEQQYEKAIQSTYLNIYHTLEYLLLSPWRKNLLITDPMNSLTPLRRDILILLEFIAIGIIQEPIVHRFQSCFSVPPSFRVTYHCLL